MAKSHNQKAKILFLEKMLRETGEKNIVTMQEILARLMEYGIPAERKSIYDDIEALRSFGMDIRFRRGRPGGYYLCQNEADSTEGSVAETEEKPLNREEQRPEYQFKKMESQNTKKKMKLICTADMEQQVRAFLGQDAKYKVKESGDISVTTSIMSDPQFYGWLVSMGTKVRISKPKKAALAYRDYLKGLIKEYKQMD